LYPVSYNLISRAWDTVVFTVTRYELNFLGRVVRFLAGEKDFFLVKFGYAQTLTQWAKGPLPPEENQAGS
jgi:hypothetical protein